MDPEKNPEGRLVPPAARDGVGGDVRRGWHPSDPRGGFDGPIRRAAARAAARGGRPLSDWLRTVVGQARHEPVELDADTAFVIALGLERPRRERSRFGYTKSQLYAITTPNVERWAEPDTRTPPFIKTYTYDHTEPGVYTHTASFTPAHPIADTEPIYEAHPRTDH